MSDILYCEKHGVCHHGAFPCYKCQGLLAEPDEAKRARGLVKLACKHDGCDHRPFWISRTDLGEVGLECQYCGESCVEVLPDGLPLTCKHEFACDHQTNAAGHDLEYLLCIHCGKEASDQEYAEYIASFEQVKAGDAGCAPSPF